MAFKINIFLACLVGCVVASLAGIWVAVQFDAGLLSFFLSVVIPVAFCYRAGLRGRKYLAAIAIYASAGWIIGGMFNPVVTMGPSARLKEIMDSPLVGHDPLIPCVIISSVLATSRSIFVKPVAAEDESE